MGGEGQNSGLETHKAGRGSGSAAPPPPRAREHSPAPGRVCSEPPRSLPARRRLLLELKWSAEAARRAGWAGCRGASPAAAAAPLASNTLNTPECGARAAAGLRKWRFTSLEAAQFASTKEKVTSVGSHYFLEE